MLQLLAEPPDASAATWALLFGVRLSVRYHMRRQRFFARLERSGALASLLAGSSTVVALLASVDERLVLAAAVATAVPGASAAIPAPGLRARQHDDLARDFIALEQDLVRAGDAVTPERLAELKTRRLQIEATEPSILRVLDAMCHNELLTVMDGDEGQRASITRRSAARRTGADSHHGPTRRRLLLIGPPDVPVEVGSLGLDPLLGLGVRCAAVASLQESGRYW